MKKPYTKPEMVVLYFPQEDDIICGPSTESAYDPQIFDEDSIQRSENLNDTQDLIID